jgi:hypothetical protein
MKKPATPLFFPDVLVKSTRDNIGSMGAGAGSLLRLSVRLVRRLPGPRPKSFIGVAHLVNSRDVLAFRSGSVMDKINGFDFNRKVHGTFG